MMSWERDTARYVAEARAILEKHGHPTTWPELQGADVQPTSRLVGLASQVVAAEAKLAEEIERGRVKPALSRFHALLVAYEEMDTLAKHPELEETAVTTARFHKNLRTGILRNQGGDRGRATQSRGVTPQELKDAIDEEMRVHPRRGIVVTRETVGKRFGISARWVAKKTDHYNPKESKKV